MKPLLASIVSLAGVLVPMTASAAHFSAAGLDLAIPDGSSVGVASTITVGGLGSVLTDVDLTLTLSGSSAFNGDFYAYLQHSGGFAVLLNRPGRTATDEFGYGDPGLTGVRFDDQATQDVHSYQVSLAPGASGPLTGSWRPDGRATSPENALGTDPRTALLSAFNGMDPNGVWTLFVADAGVGGAASLTAWSLDITAVPEPGSLVGGTAAGLMAWSLWRRRRPASV